MVTPSMCRSFARTVVCLAVVLLGCVAALGGSAAAQGTDAKAANGQATRGVREIIESATKHYQAGDYDTAASEYFAAYEKKPLPALLFNVAQSHRKAGRTEEALALYERFLREDPKSTLAPEAEGARHGDARPARRRPCNRRARGRRAPGPPAGGRGRGPGPPAPPHGYRP